MDVSTLNQKEVGEDKRKISAPNFKEQTNGPLACSMACYISKLQGIEALGHQATFCFGLHDADNYNYVISSILSFSRCHASLLFRFSVLSFFLQCFRRQHLSAGIRFQSADGLNKRICPQGLVGIAEVHVDDSRKSFCPCKPDFWWHNPFSFTFPVPKSSA